MSTGKGNAEKSQYWRRAINQRPGPEWNMYSALSAGSASWKKLNPESRSWKLK